MRGRRGSILILALWAVSLLTAYAVSIGALARQKATLMQRIETPALLREIAWSGVERARAVVALIDPNEFVQTLHDPWARPSNFPQARLGYGVCSFGKTGLIDEERKINLNKADAPTLRRLLEAAGAGADEAEALSYAIVDWRDQDSGYGHPDLGAEDSDYDDLSPSYACKDAPFELVEELMLVKGMTRPIFDKIRDIVTAHGNGAVNVHTAPPEVFAALGMNRELVDKFMLFRRGDDGEEPTSDDRVFTDPNRIATEIKNLMPLELPEESLINELVAKGLLRTSSTHFLARSTAVLDGSGATMTVESVIGPKGKVLTTKFSDVKWR